MRDSLRRQTRLLVLSVKSNAASKQAQRSRSNLPWLLNANYSNNSFSQKMRRKGWMLMLERGRRSLKDNNSFFELCALYFVPREPTLSRTCHQNEQSTKRE